MKIFISYQVARVFDGGGEGDGGWGGYALEQRKSDVMSTTGASRLV